MNQVLRGAVKQALRNKKPESLSAELEQLGWTVDSFKQAIIHQFERDNRRIRDFFDKDVRRTKMLAPLRGFLLPIHRRMDREGIPLDERTIKLGKKRWPRIYRAGVNRCWGIDIEWVDGNV